MKTINARSGTTLLPIGYAAGSDNDSIWALRLDDGQVRCYYLHELRLPHDVAHVSGILPTLAPLSKDKAHAIAEHPEYVSAHKKFIGITA